MQKKLTKKEGAWLRPQSRNVELISGLYLVATPIGNLGDVTLRALDVLGAADLVVCEDTRVTGRLLNYYGLRKKLLSYNDHNADKQRARVLAAASDGGVVALVSDAGTPMISDPGYKLVRDCVEQGVAVTSLPGANAPLTALQLSGLPGDRFCFLGFLPNKSGARRTALEEWCDVAASLIAFETAPRLPAALEDIRAVLGERDVAVVREMTKLYEEARRGKVSDLIAHYEAEGVPKGEIVLVIGPGAGEAPSGAVLAGQLRVALKTMSTKEAASYVAEITGRPRRELYTLALEISKNE